MTSVFWVPVPAAQGASQKLQSPYIANEKSLVKPGQDFTVRITTLSKSIIDKYGDIMSARKYGNDYLCLLTHFGIGANATGMPTTAINYVEHLDKIDSNILSMWGENIRSIKDYRDVGSDGNSGKIYIGTTVHCQSLGKSRMNDLREAGAQISDLVGRFAPWLAPYTTVGRLALEGVTNILDKLISHKSQCIDSRLSLYPGTLASPLPSGDAYLQTGSYIFFFQDVSDAANLYLDSSGEVVRSQAGLTDSVPPYVVINIADGVVQAPAETEYRAIATDVYEKYKVRYGLDRLKESGAVSDASVFLDGMVKVGEAYYYIGRIKRFNYLAAKSNKTDLEKERMEEIRTEIEGVFKEIKLIIPSP